MAVRAHPLAGLTKTNCLEIWSRLEYRTDYKRHFISNSRRFMSFNRLYEFLNTINADSKFPVCRRNSFGGPDKLVLEAVPMQGHQIFE